MFVEGEEAPCPPSWPRAEAPLEPKKKRAGGGWLRRVFAVMPLVVLCGLPGSGKSRRAEELRAALSADGGDGDGDGPPRRVFVVSEADFLGDGGGGRSALRAETERLLSRRDVVIVDAGSELKSFRYELYCLCKQAGTPHCLLFCPGGAARPDRPPLEPPDPGRHRWDWPLFAAPTSADEALPLAEIRAALFQRRPPPPHRSTRAEPLQAAGFLHQLDRLTQDVLAALMAAQRSSGGGGGGGGFQPGQFVPVAVEGLAMAGGGGGGGGGGGEGQETPPPPPGLRLNRPVSLAELSRLRRQFLSYAKMHPGEGEQDLPRLGNMFLQYLSRNLQ